MSAQSPLSIRYVNNVGADAWNMTYYLVEHTPHWQSIISKTVIPGPSGPDTEYERLDIYVPWIYYVIFNNHSASTGDSTRVARLYCCPDRLESLEDTIYHLPVPNILSIGEPCVSSYKAETTDSLVDKTLGAISMWWQAPFNGDALTRQKDAAKFLKLGRLKSKYKVDCSSNQANAILRGWSKLTQQQIERRKWKPYTFNLTDYRARLCFPAYGVFTQPTEVNIELRI